jgi:hypothetical protein
VKTDNPLKWWMSLNAWEQPQQIKILFWKKTGAE